MINEVLVASWGDGISLWRVDIRSIRVPTFSFRSEVTPYVSYEDYFVNAQDQQILVLLPSVVGRRVEGREIYAGAYAHLRWMLTAFGLISVGQTPLPLSGGAAGIPTPQNPYVGRFRARTVDEVAADLAALDRKLISEGMLHRELNPKIPFYERDLSDDGTTLWIRKFERSVKVQICGPGEMWSKEDKLWGEFSSLQAALPWFMGTDPNKKPDWAHLAMPQDDADQWWRDNTAEGKLSLEDDEVETYRLLGEKLPYLWPANAFLAWVEAQ